MKNKTSREEFRKELEELLNDQIYNRVVNIKYLANKIMKATGKYSESKLNQREI